jgi:hypothetical protein
MITILFKDAAKPGIDNTFADIGGSANKHNGF